MRCPYCYGETIGKICSYCGSELPQANSSQQKIVNNYYIQQPTSYENVQESDYNGLIKKDKTVALLLCIFLGVYGVHYFYVRKPGMGILYMFTAGLFGIGWVVDIIRIATGTFELGRVDFGSNNIVIGTKKYTGLKVAVGILGFLAITSMMAELWGGALGYGIAAGILGYILYKKIQNEE